MRRLGLTLGAVPGWLVLLALAGAAVGQGGFLVWVGLALIMAAAVVVFVSSLALVVSGAGGEDGGSVRGTIAAVSVVAALVAAFCGFIVGLGLSSWYLSHFGHQTAARVVEEHCYGNEVPDCEQDLRVVVAHTGEDLGWVGCNGQGHWTVGDPVGVLADPHGWFGPDMDGCARDAFGLDTALWVTATAGALAYGGGYVVAVTGRRHRDTEESQDAVAGPVDD